MALEPPLQLTYAGKPSAYQAFYINACQLLCPKKNRT